MPTFTTNQAELDAARVAKSQRHRLGDILERGYVFSTTHQTPTTNVTGQTAFDATTPTFAFYGTNLDFRGVLKRFYLAQTGTVAGGQITIAVAIDTANRNSSGGTAVTPQNMNANRSAASAWTMKYNVTATAAGGGTRYIDTIPVDADLGTVSTFDYTDNQWGGLIWAAAGTTLGKHTGSLLIYTFAATTGPTWKFGFEHHED